MATIKQIQTGFGRFIDSHIATAFEGWQRAVVVGCSTLVAANLPNLVQAYGSTPMVAGMGVYNPEAGTVDVEKVYNAFVPNMGADRIPVTIPKIGTVKIGKEDIDVLCRYIKEA